jgi:hypothetical protein
MKDEKLVEAIQSVIECAAQAPQDFCGEQREFYLPRLAIAMTGLMARFPGEAAVAMDRAKDPWGDPLYPEEVQLA